MTAARTLVTGRPGNIDGAHGGSAESPPGDVRAAAMASLQVLDPGARPPIVLAEFPRVTTNPIQALLLTSARSHGVAPVALGSLDQLAELTDIGRQGVAVALHLHWLDHVIREAPSEQDAVRRIDRFLAALDAFKAAGGGVVWTVHNVLPHVTRFEALEARLGGEVAARSDVIHVMAPRTAEIAAPWFVLPAERILHVPHPSYAGVYPDHLSRLEARARLGILPDELVFLALGAIQPYKGLTELLDAWAGAPTAGRRLVVAGIPADDPAVDDTIGRARRAPAVIVRARKIVVSDMQVYLRAADVGVFPYRTALNSGALLLGLTFGLPAIVPAASGLADLVAPPFGIVYGGSAIGLTEAMAGATRLATAEAREAARRAAESVHPTDVSVRFITGIRARLREPQA